ncbi:MAG: hypothetical protein LQ340_002932 [Diploschistes diacapsis]|nr:MAG: hypothetical protein LQ340_002932 [Diploschistes diacapsis]
MPSVLPPSVPDTALGLSSSELHTFRTHQPIALGGPGAASSRPSVAGSASTRGRGTSRSSVASSSRAGSAASSAGGGQGRLMLDAGSLSVLGSYFERLMGRIQERVDYLTAQTSRATTAQSRSVASSIAAADAEIARFKDILRQIDDLETEFDKVKHIRDIVKAYRARVEGVLGNAKTSDTINIPVSSQSDAPPGNHTGSKSAALQSKRSNSL